MAFKMKGWSPFTKKTDPPPGEYTAKKIPEPEYGPAGYMRQKDVDDYDEKLMQERQKWKRERELYGYKGSMGPKTHGETEKSKKRKSPLKKNEDKKFKLLGGSESDKGERKRRKAEKKISKAMLHAGRAKATKKLRKAEKKIEKAEKHDRKAESHRKSDGVPYASNIDPKRREEHRRKRDELKARLKK